jgi:protein-S-isoprenylcysteine O-methyltransferase Ste14
MARPWFKAAWTRIVPVAVERSTYCLLSSAALFLLFWKWQPMGGVLWNAHSASLHLFLNALYVIGWLVVLATTFLIDHFDLFGLRQVWLNPDEPALYGAWLSGLWPAHRYVRHPLYVGVGCWCFGQPR